MDKRCDATLFFQLTFDPLVGDVKASLERNRGLPTEHLLEASIVAITAANALRLAQVVPLEEVLVGDAGNEIDEPVDGDEPVRAEVNAW